MAGILIVLLPSSKLTPSALAERITWLGLPVKVKPYGFGVAVEGANEDLRRIAELAWSLDPQHVFIKPRGFPIADERFLGHSYRGLGSIRRKGLLQIDYEMELAENLAEAMGGKPSRLNTKIVECKHVREYVSALIVEDNGKKLVYCPEKRYMGEHACSGRCPYGEVVVWA
ncbi:MAG: DUF2102 domain-containing protein [Candidatus Nezhaarchaeota archaeon]|nr:DUF2102 domain-containing protein [Candidatus Nezhaarchaeota archaeon]MCX8141355.1 DUF2102 domain-containing protein [Candidatus Nezhaarchaeota archaeon]MDW8049621.1 DUF2102 domain-containing protein [Nitrososphaerota archaeon]